MRFTFRFFVLSLLLPVVSWAVVNGIPVESKEVAESHPFRNLLELNFGGQFGTGLYIGDGQILTAAHVFTMVSENILELKPSINIATLGNQRFSLNHTNSLILLDPLSTTYLNHGNRDIFVQLNNDIALVQITSVALIDQLEKEAGFSHILQGEDVAVGDTLVSVGLYWQDRKVSMVESLGGRDAQTRFATLTSVVDELGEPLDPLNMETYKFYAIPEDGRSTEPGDSGGPIFKAKSDGSLVLVGVHHGRKPVEGDELSPFWAGELFNPELLGRFVAPTSDEWLAQGRPLSAGQIMGLNNDILELLLASLSRQFVKWPHAPFRARADFQKTLGKLFMGRASGGELQAMTSELERHMRQGVGGGSGFGELRKRIIKRLALTDRP